MLVAAACRLTSAGVRTLPAAAELNALNAAVRAAAHTAMMMAALPQ